MAYSKQIQRFQERLEAIPKSVREAVQPALVKSADELADQMRKLAPVDEGDLRASIKVTPPGGTTPAYSQPGGSTIAGELEAIVTVGNQDVRYAHLVEYGTSDTSAQPYFWPAVRTMRKRFQARIKRAVNKAVRNAANKS